MVLAMTALLTHLVPAVRLKARNQFLNFRWHKPVIVLWAPRSGFVRDMLSVGPTFSLPEGALAIRPEMLGPLARDGDLICALVGHADLRPNVRAKRATTAGRQARPQENVHGTLWPGLAACRWRSA